MALVIRDKGTGGQNKVNRYFGNFGANHIRWGFSTWFMGRIRLLHSLWMVVPYDYDNGHQQMNPCFRLTRSHNRMCSRKRRDSTTVALMFSIVLVFLCCHFCKLFLNLYEAVQMIQFRTIKYWPTWADKLTRWNHLMLVINSSSNIFIYVVKVRLIFTLRQLKWECGHI